MNNYNSEAETRKHIAVVGKFILKFVSLMFSRMECHDASKLGRPEKEIFDEYTPKLADSTYGSEEYKKFLGEMKPALDHHYGFNSHHPEHFSNGVSGMSLMDVVEMLCDWKAATLRHKDGNIYKSIEINQKRFCYSDELKSILLNTAKNLNF